MLGYITSLLPYRFYKQPTCINTEAIEYSFARGYGNTVILLNILTLYVPKLDHDLTTKYNNDKFITQVIDIIGIVKYNEQLERIINNMCSSSKDIDRKVLVINKLVSYTNITELNIDARDNPFLGHLYELPINFFVENDYMSNDALLWFLHTYNPNHLVKLLSHNMRYVSREALQQLLDITVRDFLQLKDVDITSFMYECANKKCDMSRAIVLVSSVSCHLAAIITYSITKQLPSKDLDMAMCRDIIWNTEMGKSFFAAYVDSRTKSKWKSTIPKRDYNKYLYKLLE